VRKIVNRKVVPVREQTSLMAFCRRLVAVANMRGEEVAGTWRGITITARPGTDAHSLAADTYRATRSCT
jgi:hypothetical protein